MGNEKGSIAAGGDAVESHAPPPYSEEPFQQHQQQYQQQQFAPQQAPPTGQINRQFPPAFSLYRESTFGRTYVLGEHREQPLYAVSLHSGWSGQADVVLHNGPTKETPVLATVDSKKFSRSAVVTLPPVGENGSGAERTEEPLQHTSNLRNGTDSFSIETGASGTRESFEWRHSHGADVGGLGGSSWGWKLVRVSPNAPTPSGSGFGGVTSDGKEVVAVWADARMSMSKALKFQFLGSGASGALGERWAVMAVITALRIWDRERKSKQAAAGSSGGGGGGS